METMKKKVYLGSDHGGFELKNALAAHLREQGWETEDLGCYSAESCDYPDFAAAAAGFSRRMESLPSESSIA